MLLLIRKDVGLVLVTKVIIDHAPDGRFTRAGLFCNNLNGMLAVKDIIGTFPSTDLNGIDLV